MRQSLAGLAVVARQSRAQGQAGAVLAGAAQAVHPLDLAGLAAQAARDRRAHLAPFVAV